MASPSSASDAPPKTLSTPKPLKSFRRHGSSRKGKGKARQLPGNDQSADRMQVLVPGFESVEVKEGGDVRGPDGGEAVILRPRERTTTLVISASGRQCSTKNHLLAEEREAVDNDDMGDAFSPSIAGYRHQSTTFSGGGATGRKLRHWASSSILGLSKLVARGAGPFLWLTKQTSSKTIAVSEDVLATYHESFLYGKVAFSTKVRAGIRGPFWSTALLVLECIAASLSLVLYVRASYTDHSPYWITVVQFCCSFFFLLDYLIKLYSAPVRMYYALSLNGIIDLISTLPIYFILSGVMADAAIPRVFLVLRVLRAVPLLSSWALPGGAVGQQIFTLIAYSLGIFILAAGVLQWVEWQATPPSVRESSGCPSNGCISFYEAFYFIIVTVSTVGYGDITLKSEWGRLVAILVIVAAVVFIPVEINKILDLASRRPYGGKYAVQKVVGSRFIIVSGNLSYRAVEDFLSEFHHPSHAKDMRAFPLRVVIMAPFKPSFEMKVLLTEYKGRVEFIEGTPLKDSDLERVSANIASAFFLMADHLAQDQDAEDAAQIMRTLSVHRYCGSKVRLIVEMLKPENQDNPIWDDADGGIEIVCPEAICYQLLARSCQIKGISTLVINLFKAGLKVCNPVPGHWMQQYCHGQQQEIYPVILPPCFFEHELTFEEAAEIVYCKFEILLFGLDILIDEDTREVVLFPRQRLLKQTDIGLVISENLTVAEKISRYGKESSPAWYTKLHKKSNKKFRTSYDRDGLFIHVLQKRHRRHKFDNGSDSSESGKRRERQRQASGSMRFGMMSSGHRAELQTQLREIVCASTLHELGSDAADKTLQAVRCKGCMQQQQNTETQKVYSLQEAVDLITQWPPIKPEKPDQSILEKRAGIIQKNLEERTLNLVNLNKPHVLLCMQGKWPANLFSFVAHLRTPILPNPPIVIMHPHQPSIADWGCVGMFNEVYFVQGSPRHEIDLVRAGVLLAEKVVVLSQRVRDDVGKGPTSDDSGLTPSSSSVVLDVDNVLITATVERLLHPVRDRIIVELHHEIEIHYLRPKFRIDPQRFDPLLYNRNRSATFLFAPAFVEGKGFCSASLTFLLYALFFNRNTVAITEKLISGGEVVETADGEQVAGARLDQVALPESYEGRTFEEVVVGMLREEQSLTLGLYRPVGSCNSIVSYVYTNPPRGEVLHAGDLLYVLR